MHHQSSTDAAGFAKSSTARLGPPPAYGVSQRTAHRKLTASPLAVIVKMKHTGKPNYKQYDEVSQAASRSFLKGGGGVTPA